MLINNSRLERLMECPRKYYWEYIRGIVPEGSTGPDATRGIIIHAGLAAMYAGHSLDVVREVMKQKAREYLPRPALPAQLDVMDETLDWYDRILTAYFKRVYLNHSWDVKEVEVPFKTTLGDICYICGIEYTHNKCEYAPISCRNCGAEVHWLAGRADLIVKDKGRYLVVDHKTTKGASSGYINGYAYTFQQLGYVYAIKRCTQYPVSGYNINVIKMLKGIGTTSERGDPFLNMSFTATTENLDRMVHNRIMLLDKLRTNIEDMQNWHIRDDQFPMCDRQCRMSCGYHSLCWNGSTLGWMEPRDAVLRQYKERTEDYVDADQRRGLGQDSTQSSSTVCSSPQAG